MAHDHAETIRFTPAGVAAGFGREAVATVITAALWPFGVVDRGLAVAQAALRDETPLVKTPVLLVHGFGANKSNWLFLQRQLRTAGFGHLHAANANPFRTDIPTQAAHLRDRARALMSRTGTDRIHLIGHSMGGIVARYAVQVLGLHEAATVCTIASPHGGAPSARFGIGRTVAQMRTRSDVVRELQRAPIPPHTRFVAYWSELDMVVPARRALLRDHRLDATNVRVPGEGHLSIMLSRALADSIVTQLASHEGIGGHGAPIGSLEHRRHLVDRAQGDIGHPQVG